MAREKLFGLAVNRLTELTPKIHVLYRRTQAIPNIIPKIRIFVDPS